MHAHLFETAEYSAQILNSKYVVGFPFNSSQPTSAGTKHSKMLRDGLELLEYPFLTLQTFPDGFIQRIGGLVSCRSVKLLEGICYC